MYIGDDCGNEDVPEPIALIEMRLVLLAPTRIHISFSFMTRSGPMFIVISPMLMPDICSIGLADGLGDGMGICIPGMFICPCGEGDGFGEAAGILIPGGFMGMRVGEGEALGVGDAIGIVSLGCCASAEVRAQKSIRVTSSPGAIPEVFIRFTRNLRLVNGAAWSSTA